MEITESIIHGVLKARETNGDDAVTIKPRGVVLPIDARLDTLGGEVLTLYTRLSNGYGTFGDNALIHQFPVLMKRYIDQEIDLVEFSRGVCSLISVPMQEQWMATTTWPLFVRYHNQGRDWLLIAMLKLKEGVGIDEATLDLNDSLSFDVSHLYEAARIDIQKWQNNEQPYLSFIKRRAADADVTKYFRVALACTEYTDARHNTEVTVAALNDYFESQGWEPLKRQVATDRLYAHCVEKKANDEPVNLVALSAIINDQAPESFINFIRDNEYEVSEVFSPNPATYKKLMRVSRRFGSVSVSFDVNDLRNETVYYDPELQGLVIMNPPADLLAEMDKALGAQNAANDED
ncbi:hypothetical protein HBO23_16890 [Pseudomonas sp. WS 5532]|uniref:nucleoid-associated protein n=1 Tax=Pseudomonas sp. WS 5532 TaxID=2717495 RepID=UPI00147673F7|nr:nucleoid-associated protein [Pseudomonas sp. WS 5532]NMX74634.1 hypothetical protein [Pseudomonas sp. WS 5532]